MHKLVRSQNIDDASPVPCGAHEIADIERDMTDFTVRYEPSHPAADESGYVKMPNVNPLIEMSNMREASRSYEANLTMLENARAMRNRLIDMIE